MERRQGLRKRVDIQTIIERRDGSALAARIRDVSLGGLFIDAPNDVLPLYAPLRLRFTLRRRNRDEEHFWRGMVARTTPNGFGAVFRSPDPVDQNGLLALLAVADET